MNFIYFIAISSLLSVSVKAQQTFVSKKQIKIGKYENGMVRIKQTKATFIVKTDFDFKKVIGAQYKLNLITEDDEILNYHLTLKSVKWKRNEKIYQFAVEEFGGNDLKSFLQITVEPHTNYAICVVINGDDGQIYFYCNKV